MARRPLGPDSERETRRLGTTETRNQVLTANGLATGKFICQAHVVMHLADQNLLVEERSALSDPQGTSDDRDAAIKTPTIRAGPVAGGALGVAAQCSRLSCSRWLLAQWQAEVHRDMRAFDAGIAELDQACDFLFIDAGIGCRVACIDLFDGNAGTAQVVMRK